MKGISASLFKELEPQTRTYYFRDQTHKVVQHVTHLAYRENFQVLKVVDPQKIYQINMDYVHHVEIHLYKVPS